MKQKGKERDHTAVEKYGGKVTSLFCIVHAGYRQLCRLYPVLWRDEIAVQFRDTQKAKGLAKDRQISLPVLFDGSLCSPVLSMTGPEVGPECRHR